MHQIKLQSPILEWLTDQKALKNSRQLKEEQKSMDALFPSSFSFFSRIFAVINAIVTSYLPIHSFRYAQLTKKVA